jgi:hypothetical protein
MLSNVCEITYHSRDSKVWMLVWTQFVVRDCRSYQGIGQRLIPKLQPMWVWWSQDLTGLALFVLPIERVNTHGQQSPAYNGWRCDGPSNVKWGWSKVNLYFYNYNVWKITQCQRQLIDTHMFKAESTTELLRFAGAVHAVAREWKLTWCAVFSVRW